jgi:hypothetical protein
MGCRSDRAEAFRFFRLLWQESAITELIQLDGTGKEQLKLSRLMMDIVGSGKDYSQHPVLPKRVSTASRSAKSISAKHPSRI